MVKIRLTEPGFENFNGVMGMVEFVAGESQSHLNEREANRIYNALRCEFFDGELVPDIEKLKDRDKYTAIEFEQNARVMTQEELLLEKKNELKEKKKATLKSNPLSRGKLEAIADKKGLNGLKSIGAIFGVTDRSIAPLIDKILQKQKEQKALNDEQVQTK